MLRKTLLSTLLLLSNLAVAQINLDLNLTIENKDVTRTITCNALLDAITTTIIDNETLIVDVLAQENNDDVIVQANIYEKSEENGVVLVSSPTIIANWNQTATITIGEKSADEDYTIITFAVTPSRTE